MLHSSGFTITVLHVHWRIFKLNRNSAILLAAALLVAAPVAAAPGDMSVSTFLAKADALKTKGILALGSSDIKLLQSEGKAAGAAYRERIKKDLAQKRTPHSCPLQRLMSNLMILSRICGPILRQQGQAFRSPPQWLTS
jgi:hypothetical protein